MQKILSLLKKIIPKKVFKFFQPFYHYLLTLTGAIIYRFPAREINIVGITGTKGKSTTSEIVNKILEEAGYKTCLSNTIRFKIGDESRENKYKMSMPGRFFMQKFLRDAVNKKCDYAVVEITSEGVLQHRQKFIFLNSLIFTNLSPEHIESHGSYDNYVNAKLKITDYLSGPKKNTLLVVNKDDQESDKFLEKTADRKITYSLSDAKPFELDNGIKMTFQKNTFYSKLEGEFNIYNILAAATFAKEIGVSEKIIKSAIEKISEVSGRVQKIKLGQDFDVIIDYAHTPDSLEQLYKAFPNRNKICILGNTGGGRDTWKRPVMAEIADRYCHQAILTNEDPYDENPLKIVEEMEAGFKKNKPHVILNRREAIKTAILSAKIGDVVLISGKGTDPYIMEANGKKTPWSDFDVASEELDKILKSKNKKQQVL